MIAGIWRAIRRFGAGEDPPLTSIAKAMLLVLVLLATIKLTDAIAIRSLDDLKAIIIVESIGDLAGIGVILFVTMGVLMSIWRATGRPNVWFSAILAAAAGGIGVLAIPKYQKLHESAQMLLDHDPIGDPANITVKGQDIIFDGAFTPGVADRFREALKRVGKGARLVMNSNGGRQFEALKIAEDVERLKMPVYVTDTCESACTTVLVASPEASADVHAAIGFHQSTRDGSNAAEDVMFSESLREFMIEHGIEEKFVDKALSQPADDMWYPTDKELLDAGVIDKLVPGGTLKQHVKWLSDDNLPYLVDGDWMVVGATSAGNRLDLSFGFIPGSKIWRGPPVGGERKKWSVTALCKDEYYRPLLDNGATIALTDVADQSLTEVSGGDCIAHKVTMQSSAP